MGNIKLYDTVKDNQTGKRFRVTEVIGEGGNLVATLKMLDENGKAKKGRGRKMGIEALENGYTRIDLPEVTVRKIDDLSEEERKMVKVFGKKDKDAQNENQSLTGLSEEKIEKALEASTFGKVEPIPEDEKDISASDLKREVKKLEKANIELQRDLDVVCAECTDLRSERDALKNVPPSHAVERDRLQQELTDAKKTISKMKQEHEAEVRELNDALMEAKAEANAVRKSKEEALSDYHNAVDMLDSDSVAFEAILDLAHIAQSVSQSLYKVSKRIEAETEGRI